MIYVSGLAVIAALAAFALPEDARRAKLAQQTPDCSDFDVILPGEDTPSFRVVLPEKIMEKGGDLASGTHMILGKWQPTKAGTKGTFIVGRIAQVTAVVEPRASEICARLDIKNLTAEEWTGVRVEICTAVNHLPGSPSWANRQFIPSLPLDRDQQGRCWFEEVTPGNLQALTEDGWVGMHPCPDNPSADSVPKYSFTPSAHDDAFACAAGSHDGRTLFFQAWDTRCLYVTPCPGNACMHLWPLVARSLKPGHSASIHGVVGMFSGERDKLEQKLRRFHALRK